MRPLHREKWKSPGAMAACAAVALACVRCGDSDGGNSAVAVSVAVGGVVLAPVEGGLAPADASACQKAASQMIAKLPKLMMREKSENAPRLDVTGLWENRAGEVALSLEGKVRSQALRVPLGARIVATGPAGDRGSEIALLSRGMDDLGAALASLFSLYGGDESAWIRALDAAEPDEQLLALSLLADAKSRAAIPAIGRALKDPRERVAEAAADALVAIGDEGAVPILIGAIRRNDVRSEVRAIESISRLGGREARAYLEMTALGHESPEVRALSQDALTRLQRNASKNGAESR